MGYLTLVSVSLKIKKTEKTRHGNDLYHSNGNIKRDELIQFAVKSSISQYQKLCVAAGPGFEPGLDDSESSVLPLNDPANLW